VGAVPRLLLHSLGPSTFLPMNTRAK
jgi:hypothetical protein